MFWEKNEEAFLCYRIKDFFEKLVIVGQSPGKNNNNVWKKKVQGKNCAEGVS